MTEIHLYKDDHGNKLVSRFYKSIGVWVVIGRDTKGKRLDKKIVRRLFNEYKNDRKK
jgi:hypothetical protein